MHLLMNLVWGLWKPLISNYGKRDKNLEQKIAHEQTCTYLHDYPLLLILFIMLQVTCFILTSFVSLLTHEMPLKSRKCEFNFLFMTHYKSVIMSLFTERFQGRIYKIKIVKNVHPAVVDIEGLFIESWSTITRYRRVLNQLSKNDESPDESIFSQLAQYRAWISSDSGSWQNE